MLLGEEDYAREEMYERSCGLPLSHHEAMFRLHWELLRRVATAESMNDINEHLMSRLRFRRHRVRLEGKAGSGVLTYYWERVFVPNQDNQNAGRLPADFD